MAAKLSEGLEEQVTCPICLEHYSDPRLLHCLHTYCRQCLQDLLDKGERKVSVVCPQCREVVQITSGDVTKLKVNFWINSLLSLLAIHSTEQEKDGGKAELTCENCDSQAAAKGRCVNCCMFLCNVCFTAHHRLQALKEHQLMTLDELKDTGIPVIEKPLFCEKHKGEVKKLFCSTCKELICRDCTIIDHRDHQFNFAEFIADQHKQLFKTEVERASNTKNKIEGVLKTVQEMKENVEKTSKATEKDIDDFINKQIRALEEKRASLKETTKKIAAMKTKELAAQEEDLAMHLVGLESAIEFTEKVLTNGGSSDVLSISERLTSRLSQLSEKPFPEDLHLEDPWQKKKSRLEYNEKLFVDSINRVEVADLIVDYSLCSVVQRLDGRLVDIKGPVNATFGPVLEFVVQIKNSSGENLKFMTDRIIVEQVFTWIGLRLGKSKCHAIRSLEDGTYSFNVAASSDDKEIRRLGCAISVLVDGRKVSGSPFNVSWENKI